MRCLLAVLILIPWLSQAATIHVATNGNDTTGDGSSATPYRTINKGKTVAVSGDTVNIWGGDFDEYTQVTDVLGVRFQSLSNATTRAFRFDTSSNTLAGVWVDKAANADFRSWDAFVYLNSSAHFTTITNCKIINQPWLSATNWSINPSGAGTNTISSPSVDFIAAGFKVGGRVYINGVSYSNTTRGAEYRFVNQGRSVIPTNVTTTSMTFSNGVLLAETNPSVWAVISAGSDYNFKGIFFAPSGGSGPTNCIITGCTFSNTVGVPIFLTGKESVVSNCNFEAVYGNSILVHGGPSHSFVSNFVYRCPAPAYYSELDIVDHTGGAFYDYYVSIIAGSSSQTDNTNFLFQGNWIEENDGNSISIQHVVIGDESDFHTYKAIGNVFIGVAGPLSGGQNKMWIQSNTFYRCSFQSAYSELPVAIGGEENVYTNNTVFFTENLMVANGDHRVHTSEGYPTITFTTGIVSSNNFVCGPEVSKWNPMSGFPATNGINGGDPMFINEFVPRGPDGIPFTADDGLRLHPNSPAVGIGALGTKTNLSAFFRPVNLASNFLDWKGTNFNLPWHTNLYAFQRTSWDREYDYGDAIANLPQCVTFEATNSISGNYSTNAWYGIRDFVWNFGDGSSNVWTRWPDVSHTFVLTGQVTVMLTVTNWANQTSTHQRNYRILPGTNYANDVFYVSDAGNDANNGAYTNQWRTVTNGIQNLTAGDVLVVTGNHSNEMVDLNLVTGAVDGTAADPIRIISIGATIKGLSQRKNNWYWEGFEMVAKGQITNAPTFPAAVSLPTPVVTNVAFRNFSFQNTTGSLYFVECKLDGGGIYNRNIYFTNCLVLDTEDKVFIFNASNSIVDACIVKRIRHEGDFIAGNGVDNVFSRNYVADLGYTNNSHSDAFEGATGAGFSKNWHIRQNWVETTDTNILTQVTSMGDPTYPHDGTYTNIQIYNNVFIFMSGGLAPIGLDGPKVWNNLFAYVGHQTSHAIVHGGQGGGLIGIDVRNNIFFGCGAGGVNTNAGWYANGTQTESTNSTFAFADYNYVAGSNFTAKAVAPPDDLLHWAVTGQEVHGVNGGDPKFTDSANYDFRLLSTSPLINAGVVLSGFTTDFWGRERGATWDIGPFDSLTEVTGGTNRITTRLR